PARSFLVGQTLHNLARRAKDGLNVVVIVRDGEDMVAPKSSEALYPGDHILCFATDIEIERCKDDINVRMEGDESSKHLESFDLRRFTVQSNSSFNRDPIRTSGIREKFDCIVVGLERGGHRNRSPKSDTVLLDGDVLWVVGARKKLQEL